MYLPIYRIMCIDNVFEKHVVVGIQICNRISVIRGGYIILIVRIVLVVCEWSKMIITIITI